MHACYTVYGLNGRCPDPFLSAVIGMVLIFASVVFFMFTEDSKRIVAVSLGLFFIRDEVRRFLRLIGQVSAANESADPEQRLAEIKVSMLPDAWASKG